MVLDWLCHSPDLNSLQHYYLRKRRPKGGTPSKQQLNEDALKAWKNIPKERSVGHRIDELHAKDLQLIKG